MSVTVKSAKTGKTGGTGRVKKVPVKVEKVAPQSPVRPVTPEPETDRESVRVKKPTREELREILTSIQNGTMTVEQGMERMGGRKKETKTPEGMTGMRTAIMTLLGMNKERFPETINELYERIGKDGPMLAASTIMEAIAESDEYNETWKEAMKDLKELKLKREQKEERKQFLQTLENGFMATMMKIYEIDAGDISYEMGYGELIETLKKVKTEGKKRCGAKTGKGEQCKRMGKGEYCGMHMKGRKFGDYEDGESGEIGEEESGEET